MILKLIFQLSVLLGCTFALAIAGHAKPHRSPLKICKNRPTATAAAIIAQSNSSSASSMFIGDEWKQKLTYREKLIAGSLARFTAQTLLHPMEVLKARAQSRSVEPFHAQALLKGAVPQIGLSLPAGALQFSSIELIKEALSSSRLLGGLSQDARNFLAGLLGTLVSMLVKVPQEVLKQGCQTGLYADSYDACVTIWGRSGIGGFYRGLGAQVARDLPWNALSYTIFNMAKRSYEKTVGRATSYHENMLLGALGGALAGVVSNPIDVVKTRIMTQAVDQEPLYTGVWQTCVRLVQEEGWTVLLRGTLYRVLYLAPLAAVIYAMYELVAKKLMMQRLQQMMIQKQQQQGVL